MKKLEPFYDPRDMSACVTADTVIEEFNATAAADDLIFPLFLDPSGTVGELIASTPFAPRSFRYGPVADNILGLVFELDGGKELQLGGRVVKNVTGFDFTRFLCRSGDRFGQVRRAVLRLRALSESTQYRTISGDIDKLTAFSSAFRQNPWAAIIDLFDMIIERDAAVIQLAYGCTASRVEQVDHFLSGAATDAGLHFSATDHAAPVTEPYATAKTVFSRCIPDCRRLVETCGGRAHIFLGNAFIQYESADESDPALVPLLQELHRVYGALGGHVKCADLVYPEDAIDARWEAGFRSRLAELP